MRISLLIIFVAASVLAISTPPRIERSAAVFTGRVLSTQKIKVQTDKFGKWEIWRAEVRIHSITKQDTNLAENVFVYYEQDHFGEDGTHYIEACPGRPDIVDGATNRFFCIRRDAGDVKGTLFIPERSWVTAP